MRPGDGHVLSAEIERVAKAGQYAVARVLDNIRLAQDVTGKDLILLALIPVDARVGLVVNAGQGSRIDVIVATRGDDVRLGICIQAEDVLRDWIDGGDFVARDRCANQDSLPLQRAAGAGDRRLRSRTEDLAGVIVVIGRAAGAAQIARRSRQQVAHVAGLLSICGHNRERRLPLNLPQPLIVGKEEEVLRPDDGTAERCAVLIAALFRLDRVEVVRSIERVVAQEVVYRTVKFVCPRLGDKVDRRACRLPESCIVNVGLDLEFLNGIGGGLHGEAAEAQVPGVGAVNQSVVTRRTGAVCRISLFAKG